jgi:hypothetical protein
MRSNAWPESALAALAACSLEAAWITLAYVTVWGLMGQGPAPLSILAFAGAALVGLAYTRWSAQDRRRSYRTPLAAIVVAMAAIGWLLPLGPSAGQLFERPMVVLGMHPGGILLGLAVLRGTAHATPDDDERIAEAALGPGLVGVAGVWVLLTATGIAREPPIFDAAFSATVTFVTAALLSIGLARLTGLRKAGVLGADRRAWVGVLVGVVVSMLAVALPLALILGVPLDHAIRGALGPLADVLVPIATLFLWPAAFLATLLVLLVEFLRGDLAHAISTPGGIAGMVGIDWGNPLGPSGAQGVILGLIPVVIAIVVAFLLVRALVGRPRLSTVEDDLIETRETERPTRGIRLSRPQLLVPRRPRDPKTASEAYLASLEVLSHRPESARRGSETPSEHANRLRDDPISLPFGRLAADYALAEFGGRTLTPAEHRRAIVRWRQLRSIRAGSDGSRPSH